jgi:hypothetical protein
LEAASIGGFFHIHSSQVLGADPTGKPLAGRWNN